MPKKSTVVLLYYRHKRLDLMSNVYAYCYFSRMDLKQNIHFTQPINVIKLISHMLPFASFIPTKSEQCVLPSCWITSHTLAPDIVIKFKLQRFRTLIHTN
jgi:hypothetical protein